MLAIQQKKSEEIIHKSEKKNNKKIKENNTQSLENNKLLSKPKEYNVRFEFPETTYISPPILEVCESSFKYEDDPYLFRNIDFGIDTTSRVCIVGPNGVGKSTLLKIITGNINVNEGEVRRNSRI